MSNSFPRLSTMILTIGIGYNQLSVKKAEEVAEAWLEELQKRNPNVSCFWLFHADEPDSAPHDGTIIVAVKQARFEPTVSQNGALDGARLFPERRWQVTTPQTQFPAR